MRSYRILLSFIVLFTLKGEAQKHDYVWILGSKSSNLDSCLSGMELNFNSNLKINKVPINRIMSGHSNTFSDINGKLKYYTNGCALIMPGDQIMDSGDSLNLLYDYDAFCTGPEPPHGVPFPNASLFLPLNNGNLLYVSLETWIIPNKYPNVFSPNILSTLIDTIKNEVIYKNRELLTERSTLSRFGLTACKHIDNRSWWVIARNELDSLFRILLINSDTIISKSQSIGKKYVSGDLGQSGFCPDGKWFAWYSKTNGLELMQFDREYGILFDYRQIPIVDTFEYGYGGIAFSPNSQFLYVSTQGDLFQIDLSSNNIEQSIMHIHHFSGSLCECGIKFPTYYYQMQLGPDCKIYMSSTSSAHCLHVILYPDRKGKDCQFIEAGLNLPSLNQKSLPQFPIYRIAQAYPCDSTIKFVSSNLDFGEDYIIKQVYPNPGFDMLQLDIALGSFKEASFTLLDVNGIIVLKQHISNHHEHYSFDIRDIPSGIYFYSIQSKEKILRNGKFVKMD